MGFITKDFWNHLLWGTFAIATGIFSFIVAEERPESTLIIVLAFVFVAVGVFLIVSAWWRRQDFRNLLVEGKKNVAWISAHHTGAGENSATSFLVKVYLSEKSPNASIMFETDEVDSLREVVKKRQIVEATLLKRKRNTGLVVIYFNEQAILPSGKVRYFC